MPLLYLEVIVFEFCTKIIADATNNNKEQEANVSTNMTTSASGTVWLRHTHEN